MAPAATSLSPAMLARVGPSVAGRAHARAGPLPAAGRVVWSTTANRQHRSSSGGDRCLLTDSEARWIY